MLIEDKASGTQMIQELVQQGLHAVTRYQPQADKIMRMHAMIENGFVHLPKEAAWLPEYLHELTVFPKGKHDDQVDSTAQMLDWVNAGSEPQGWMWTMYKELAAEPHTARPEPLATVRTDWAFSADREGGPIQSVRRYICQEVENHRAMSAADTFADSPSIELRRRLVT